MSRSLTIALVTMLAGCTFNVSSFSRDVTSTGPTFDHLRADFSGADLASDLQIDGTGTTPTAVVTLSGLLGSGANADAVVAGVHVAWPMATGDATTHGLTIGYDGPMLETISIEGIRVALPATTTLDLTLGSNSTSIRGMTAAIQVVAESGSIDIHDAGDFVLSAQSGSIDVSGHGGTASCSSGSVHFEATGAMISHTSSGSIDGSFGEGGEMTATSGSVDVTLTGALTQDLTLSAGSGSIHLVVPAGASMRIETHTGSGSSHVDVGGTSSSDDFTGTIGGGGFLVRATTGSGSIHISDQ